MYRGLLYLLMISGCVVYAADDAIQTVKQLAQQIMLKHTSESALKTLYDDPQVWADSLSDLPEDMHKPVVRELLRKYKLVLTVPRRSRTFENVSVCAYHPNGNYLAIAYYNNNDISIWDVHTEQESLQLKGHKKLIRELVFNDEGTQLASGGQDGVILLWNAITWEQDGMLDDNERDRNDQSVRHLCYNPKNAAQLLSLKVFSDTIKIWDTQQAQLINKKKGNVFAYNKTGTFCAIGLKNNLEKELKIYDTTTWEHVCTIPCCCMGAEISSVAWHPNNDRLAVSFDHYSIALQGDKGLDHITLVGQGVWPVVAFNKKGTRLIVTCAKNIHLWDTTHMLHNDSMLHIWLRDNTMSVTGLIACHPDNKQFATLGLADHRECRLTSIMRIMKASCYKEVTEALSLVQAAYIYGRLANDHKRDMFDNLSPRLQAIHASLPDTHIKNVIGEFSAPYWDDMSLKKLGHNKEHIS